MGFSLVTVRERLVAVVCLVVDHEHEDPGASGAVAPGLSCSETGTLPDQELNLSPALAGGFFATEPPGKPCLRESWLHCFPSFQFLSVRGLDPRQHSSSLLQ